MILSELELENYKQFTGKHIFAPTQDGVIGIIGPNGAGKTTLFEAIEWCLYNPREIPNDELRPRGKAGRPRVKLTLQDPIDGVKYIIQRELKSAAVSAEIWREDQSESRIVHGSRPVTDYVAKTLIGLDHRAFVSTFFTRQKELSFFGDLGVTDRRREVSRLLGFETIRDAQQLIAEERRLAEAESLGLTRQYEEQSKGRDFAAELEAQDEAIANSVRAVSEATERLTTASASLASARGNLSRLQGLERKNAGLLREIERISGGIREAAAIREFATQELENLAASESQRAKLAQVAGEEAALRTTVEAFVREQDRHRHLVNFLEQSSRAQQGITRGVADLEKTVKSSTTPLVPDWIIRPSDVNNPIVSVERLVGVGEGVDPQKSRLRFEALATCNQLAREQEEAESKLRKFEDRLRDLEAEREALVAGSDPSHEAELAAKERESALVLAEQQRSMTTSTLKNRGLIANVVSDLQAQNFEGVCPTCGRPFEEHEAPLTIASLMDRIADIDAELAELKLGEEQAQRKAKDCELARNAALKRMEQVNVLEGRISQGKPMVESAREELALKSTEFAKAMKEHGLKKPPTQVEVDAARSESESLQKVQNAVGVVRQLRATIKQFAGENEAAEKDIAALGTVSYDEAAHAQADSALAKATEAATTIRQIDRELARRPQLEADHANAKREIERLDLEKSRVEKDRMALGFVQQELEDAVVAEQAALDDERAAREATNDATMAQRETESARKNLLSDQERINGLSLKAEERQRASDELARMYREFTLFDQFVANKITPELAGHASALVAEITDGKYDKIEFDDNYGIRVFDGNDHYPLEEFSGGERDVIALCARLALSRLVGSQARRPISFLVLDEVFGSLDRDRREHLIETLERLSGTAEAFRQLFIISHVENVRQELATNETWRITETADGVSELENVTETGSMEEV